MDTVISRGRYSRPDPFYNRQPSVPKEEAYQAVGTRVISEDQAEPRRFYLYTRQRVFRRWRSLGTIRTGTQDYSIVSVQFAM